MPAMARSARSNNRARGPLLGWPAIEAAIVRRLAAEPAAGGLVATLVLLAAVLYLAGLGFPLVFADFALLTESQLRAYARELPAFGTAWLPQATFGWTAALVGTEWFWHRALNFALHALTVLVAFALFCRIVPAAVGGESRIASGWVAFAAAALFAVHPVAVYGVAYLAARDALLTGLFALVALWAVVRAREAHGRAAALAAVAATGLALACSPDAAGIPLAMALVVAALPAPAPGGAMRAWIAVAAAGILAAGWLAAGPDAAAPASFVDAVAAACSRFLRYLALWLVPVTPFMAIDMPEAAVTASDAWPGWLGIAGVVALVLLTVAIFVRRRTGWLRVAALGFGCVAALQLPQLAWPPLGAELSLARSYAWMPCIALLPACLLAALPVRAAWPASSVLVLGALVLAADTLQTFSSHVALWDDAVRRVERLGPKREDARIYFNRATVHRSDGHTIAALADYDRALELDPTLARALRGRAQVLIDEKRYGEALRDFDRLLELEPDQAITHAHRGLALMQSGRLHEAGHAFDRAIALGAKEPRVYLNRGLTRLQLGGLAAAASALADIERALALDPGYALGYYNRAIVFEQAANAGLRLRDALSPELMRVVAAQNFERACQLGHAAACERQRAQAEETLPGASEGPVRVAPETSRQQGMPTGR